MSDEKISIEETNKLRAKLGLKPLVESKEENKEKVAEDNFLRHKEDKEQKIREQELLESIEKSKAKLDLKKKYSGKGLGEKDEDEDESALGWIKKNKKRLVQTQKTPNDSRKPTGNKLKTTLAKGKNFDEAQDVRVGHDLEDFDEGGETILTLKDSNVLGEDDDELVNVQMMEKERLGKNLENKRKKTNYNPYDDEEFSVGTFDPKKKSILAHYDEDIDNAVIKKKGFRIDALRDTIADTYNSADSDGQGGSGKGVSLDFNNLVEIKDYYTKEEADLVFKKPKTKKKKKSRKVNQDDGFNFSTGKNNNMEGLETETVFFKPIDPNTNFVDDDDLQEALAKSRRVAIKATKTTTEEDFVEQVVGNNNVQEAEGDEENEGLIISDTSEFVQNLTQASQILNDNILKNQQKLEQSKKPKKDQIIKEEEIKNKEVDEEIKNVKEVKIEEGVDSLFDDTAKLGKGLAGTLALLASKGMYKAPTTQQIKQDSLMSDQAKWIQEQKKREKEKSSNKGSDRRDRDRGGRSGRDRDDDYGGRDYSFADESMRRMENYKPDIKIEHKDQFGNVLDQKEAFRLLSHKFHGKTSGLKKTEKRMEKIENNKRMNAMVSTDTPLGTAEAAAKRQKAKGSAHIVLEGNK